MNLFSSKEFHNSSSSVIMDCSQMSGMNDDSQQHPQSSLERLATETCFSSKTLNLSLETPSSTPSTSPLQNTSVPPINPNQETMSSVPSSTSSQIAFGHTLNSSRETESHAPSNTSSQYASSPSLNPNQILEAVAPSTTPSINAAEKFKTMGPPLPRLPPKITKADLPGPRGPPPVRLNSSKEEVIDKAGVSVDAPVEGDNVSRPEESNEHIKEGTEVGKDNGEPKPVEATTKLKVATEPVSSGPPYVKPPWSATPGQPYKLEVLKEGVIMSNFDVSTKEAYMFGRSDRCDFALEHPSLSRYHAVLQYNNKGEAFIYDLGSTHGTFINKRQVKAKVYAPVQVGGLIRFGLSTRLYVLQGPNELMPEEGLSKKERLALKEAEAAQQVALRAASLKRAKAEVAAMEGASWGMQEDAEEVEEENVEEVTWQSYKGPLTEKQQKTLEKVHKRNEKMANLKRENDAIQVKEIGQGGLTQGQHTQMARNEQRIAQLMEELESLEETVNESIQESVGARSGKGTSKKKPVFEDEEDDLSDDEFYDRTRKRNKNMGEAVQKVETAETLLEKRDVLAKEMEVVSSELKAEEARTMEKARTEAATESIDPLDAFMSSVSSKIVKDQAARLTKELASLQAEADRVARLLKIADPSGEGARKWESKAKGSSQSLAVNNIVESRLRLRARKESAKELASQIAQNEKIEQNSEVTNPPSNVGVNLDQGDVAVESEEVPFLLPPLLLGAPRLESAKIESSGSQMSIEKETQIGSEFVGYLDRKKSKVATEEGTIIQVEERVSEGLLGEGRDGGANAALEAIALILKHNSGLSSKGGAGGQESQTSTGQGEKKARRKKKRKLGAERPPLLVNEYESEEAWIPPEGQTGDGRTSLNEKFGY